MDDQIDPGDNFFGINLSDCALINPQGTQKAMDALRADTVSVVGPWKEPDDGVFVWGNAPSWATDAHTEPQDAQPTDAQQTASDVKAAPERRPDGTLKPVARAWEAPKRTIDVRRLGG